MAASLNSSPAPSQPPPSVTMKQDMGCGSQYRLLSGSPWRLNKCYAWFPATDSLLTWHGL